MKPMEQTFEELFESTQYNQNIKRGQIIEANVINITDDHAVLSAGLKSESFVNINQFKNSEGEVEVSIGDKVKGFGSKSLDLIRILNQRF